MQLTPQPMALAFPSDFTYFDLVTWRLMFLPVHSSLKTPMTSDHVLIQLLRHIEIRHTNQIAAMLEKSNN